MPTVGQAEIRTQKRALQLLQDRLGYDYLGDWADEPDNRNIEDEYLQKWLEGRGIEAQLITRAISELDKASSDASKSLYDRNKAVYDLLRYGVKIKPGHGENTVTIWLIDWQHWDKNHFAVAEEVTVKGADAKAATKRPDIVIYVNGIALGVIELKRSSVSVLEGVYQNLDNQKKEFIQPFFTTQQWLIAGNDSEGLRYGTIETPAKHYLKWIEEEGAYANEPNLLDRHLLQICNKQRFLELIHDFVVFDAGRKKLCRQNQYFGIKAAQDFIKRRKGGIIWHTQGSGKSLTMVWLAKWILANRSGSRVLIVTDRTELDEQIAKVFTGVNETIYRTTSGDDLIKKLGTTEHSLICSLVHKFAGKNSEEDEGDGESVKAFTEALSRLPKDFTAPGDIHVFVDECHRTQSGDLHKAMKALLPNALFIGFTGTPLLKADKKKKSIEVFGRYIHTYKFDQAVREGVVLDLRYEARDVDQKITSQKKIDEWFDLKTKGLNNIAKAQLRKKWGNMQQLLSSQSRLSRIVADIVMDMNKKPRLMDGHGNAMLVAGSIYEACKYFELFQGTELKGHCAVVSSYTPSIDKAKGEATGEGETDNLVKYKIYRKMLAEWFDEPEEVAVNKAEKFELDVKKQFIEQPAKMRLLIVVDKLLTGFDAPSATYLYIDKQMRDHGLFQAICRVNRLDGEEKDYGYIIDYKDLFQRLESAVDAYTVGALDGYDKADVAGLLKDRLEEGRQDLEDAREAIKALCEPVLQPKGLTDYFHYFCAEESGNGEQLTANEPKRLKLYQYTSTLLRCYANLANELEEAGYSAKDVAEIKKEAEHYTQARDAVRLNSEDYIDLKALEPAMRHLMDTYISADDSKVISAFDDMSLIQLIVERGPEALDALPENIKKSEEAVAETIENNVRKLIINESPIDPAYYEKMSKLLDALIEQRRQGAIKYQEYLQQVAELSKKVIKPVSDAGAHSPAINTEALRALFNNLGNNEALAIKVDVVVRESLQDDWRNNAMKTKRVRAAIRHVLATVIPMGGGYSVQNSGEAEAILDLESESDRILDLVRHQNDY